MSAGMVVELQAEAESIWPRKSKYNSYIYMLKFMYSEKATQFCEISTLLLIGTT